MKQTLYMHHTGPVMLFNGGILEISDLNPSLYTRWRMTRLDMLRLAWRAFLAAAF